jgi:hypothetical protein
VDRVYRPIDHGKAWLTVNQSPWLKLTGAHPTAALSVKASSEQHGEEEDGSGTPFGPLPELERKWKGRATAVRNGSAWSSVAARWK